MNKNVWMTKIEISRDCQKVNELIAVSSPYELHRSVMSLFPQAKTDAARKELGVLFRQEGRDGRRIIIQSLTEPDLKKAARPIFSSAQTRLAEDLEFLSTGDELVFRLLANPSKKVNETGKRPRRVALFALEEQENWLAAQGARNGFSIKNVVTSPQRMMSTKRGRSRDQIRVSAVEFNGVLQINDRELFLSALREGLGQGKAFGLGLLSVKRVSSIHE